MENGVESAADRKRASVRRWYNTHREEFSETRRERYAKDPKMRAAAKKRAAKYRNNRRKGLKVSRTLIRQLNGDEVEVLTTGFIADRLKITAHTIRNWESAGLIPESLFEGKHRLYTRNQFELIRMVRQAMAKEGEVPPELVAHIHRSWEDNYARPVPSKARRRKGK